MSTVRKATTNDIAALSAMGEKFLAYSEYGSIAPVAGADLGRGIARFVEGGFAYVAEIDGKVVGALLGIMSPVWFAPEIRYAIEIAWWVNEEARGGRAAFRLLNAFEAWARDNGARAVVLSDLVINGETPVGKIVERLGYRMVERSHLKEL